MLPYVEESGLKAKLHMIEYIVLKYKRFFYGSSHFFVIIDLICAENQIPELISDPCIYPKKV